MSMVSVQLEDALQGLIDFRLDTIDRMLLGRMPRQDRLAIVKEVESQIYEQLHERGADEVGRDDVLAVLARLDPPEAYLPEESDEGPAVGIRPGPSRPLGPARRKDARASFVSGIVGLSALAALFALTPLIYFIADMVFESTTLLFAGLLGTILLAFAGGAVAVVMGIRARKGGGWAIVGVAAGSIAVSLSPGLGLIVLVSL